MRPTLAFALLLFVCLALTVPANGGPVSQGDRELSGSFAWATASYSYEDEDLGSETALRFAPGFGYFATDSTEFRLLFPITFESYDWDWRRSDYSYTVMGPQVAVLFHFGGTETFVPYVGAGTGASWASDSEDGDYDTVFILPSLHLGFRSFFTESACLTTEFLYQHQLNALFEEDVSANVFALTAGFGVFF